MDNFYRLAWEGDVAITLACFHGPPSKEQLNFYSGHDVDWSDEELSALIRGESVRDYYQLEKLTVHKGEF